MTFSPVSFIAVGLALTAILGYVTYQLRRRDPIWRALTDDAGTDWEPRALAASATLGFALLALLAWLVAMAMAEMQIAGIFLFYLLAMLASFAVWWSLRDDTGGGRNGGATPA